MKSKILFIAATHGNEDFSIETLKKLELTHPKGEYRYEWIIGNPKAQEENVRFIDKDLNRSAPGDENSAIYEEKRAAEILQIAKQYQLVIDIHGTRSSSGIITLIPKPTLQNVFLASLFSIKRNVIWYAKSSLQKGPLVQFINCPAIEIECGPKHDKKIADELYNILKIFLENNKLPNATIFNNLTIKEFYAVYGKLLGEHNPYLQDFKEIEIDNERFYPILSGNEYHGVTCYKMKKVEIENNFLY